MLSERECRECSGDGRLDEERTCDACEGDGLSPVGKAHQKRCERAARIVDGAGLGLHGARREIYLGHYREAANALRGRAQELLDAADLIDGQEPVADEQERLPIACGQHVHPAGHPARDAKCVLQAMHAGPCSAQATRAA